MQVGVELPVRGVVTQKGPRTRVTTPDGDRFLSTPLEALETTPVPASAPALTLSWEDRLLARFEVGTVFYFDGKPVRVLSISSTLLVELIPPEGDEETRTLRRLRLSPTQLDLPEGPKELLLKGFLALGWRLLREHNLEGWYFQLCGDEVLMGSCDHTLRTINLSTPHALRDPRSVKDTILHEIAHALVGFEHGHDETWRRVARSLGCKDKPEAKARPRYIVSCRCKVSAAVVLTKLRHCPRCKSTKAQPFSQKAWRAERKLRADKERDKGRDSREEREDSQPDPEDESEPRKRKSRT